MSALYHVKILGQLWIGGTAAKTETLTAGEGPFKTDVDDCTVSGYVELHEGDFQRIIDMEIVKEKIDRRPIKDGYVEHHVFTTIREWASEESLCAFSDCMEGAE